MASTDDFLKHYGVKGMRWGVRRSASSASKPRRFEQYRGKNLDQIVDRYNKEKLLKDLLEDDLQPKRAAARRFTKDLFKQHSTLLVTSLIGAAGIGAAAAAASKNATNILALTAGNR